MKAKLAGVEYKQVVKPSELCCLLLSSNCSDFIIGLHVIIVIVIIVLNNKSLHIRHTTTLCSEKKHPLTFSFISP